MKKIERFFELILWNSRMVVLSAVIASLAASIAMFYLSTVDTWYMIVHLGEYASSHLDHMAKQALRTESIALVVEILDGYLLAAVMLIFSLGLYELFISKLENAEESEAAANILFIDSLDALKARLGKVVLMMLIVKLFQQALRMRFESPTDLLALAGCIALVGLALYLSHVGETGVGKH